MSDEVLVLERPGARLVVDPRQGARLASVTVDGIELLVTEGFGPVMWGSYPMAPWAGRIRDARFDFRGRAVELRPNDPPHALHGTVFDRPWTVTGPDSLAIDLGPGWPFAGRVAQSFALREDGLTVTMRLEAEDAMPAVVGWHPWFRRTLKVGDTTSAPSRLDLPARTMYLRGESGIADGRLAPPTPGPWDDCFTDLAGPPVLTWPDVLELDLTSSCDHWVVYDQLDHAICVEPQSGPPDFVRIRPAVVEAGDALEAWMSWRWRRLD